MPLSMPGSSQPIYPTMYTTTPPRYPTAPYYQYPPAPGYYSGMPTHSAPVQPTASSSAPPATQFISTTSTATAPTLTMASSNPAGASGAWADEEVERLKRLAEQSRTSGSSNETDWDWVVSQWGNTRTRFAKYLISLYFNADDLYLDIKYFSRRQRLASKKARLAASNEGEKATSTIHLKDHRLQHHP